MVMKKTNTINLLIGLFAFIFGVVMPLEIVAQHSVSGTVVDSTSSEVLPGVNVVVQGTNIGTATDAEGEFDLEVPSSQETLVFSFIGYQTKEVPINGRSTINVELISQAISGEEIMVVGYGTQRQEDVTSSISKVSDEDFTTVNVKDPLQMLQGKVAGLNISSHSGSPNEGVDISLRGQTTIQGNSDPLIIVDGVPGVSLDAVSPRDIESIDILKDGSAAAIYGTRGTNGVILVTTKGGGDAGQVQVDYEGYVSTETIKKRIEVLSAQDYRDIQEGTHPLSDVLNVTDYGYSTNWLDEITRDPVSHSHNLRVSTGTENSSFVATGNFRDVQGLFMSSDRKDMNGRLRYDQSLLDDMLSFNFNLLASQTASSLFDDYAYQQAIWRNPTDRVKDDDGNWQERNIREQYNPVGLNKELTDDREDSRLMYSGQVSLEPIDGFEVSTRYSRTSEESLAGHAETKDHISTTVNGLNGVAWRSTNKSIDQNFVLTAEYDGQIGNDHQFNVIGGYDYQDFEDEDFFAYNEDFPTDVFGYNNLGIGNALPDGRANMSSGKSSSKLIAFFGRANYNFDNRYLVTASLRREGSTRFGEDNKWGYFPAVSVGWRITNESFAEDIEFLSDLKMRVGYGVTGTQPTQNNLSQTLLQFSDRALMNGQFTQGVVPASNPNPNLRWEKKTEINIGLDVGVLENRITGTLDLFRRETEDLLFEFPVPVPPNLYPTTVANSGAILNKGIEFSVNTIPVQTSDLSWNVNFNITHLQNELLRINSDQFTTGQNYFDTGDTGAPIQNVTHRVEVGKPLGNFWSWKVDGIDENGEWEFIDRNDDGIINEDDKFITGNGNPDVFAGLTSSVRFQDFDLSVTASGMFGHQILNFTRMHNETTAGRGGRNYPKTLLDQPFGSDTYIQGSPQIIDYFIEDGDFVKIENITFGYTLPIQNQFVRSGRVYVSGDNLFTFTGYSGVDPEVDFSGLAPGNDDRAKFPTTRSFTLGVELGF
jgi:TonB-linked SusC/RagA family outer membrane protein